MNRPLSIYLDLIRFGAAVVVVFSHVWVLAVPDHPWFWPGHYAVMVFFVLSGYVIAYATDRREQGLTDYAVHRLGRIWSVAIPALLLGAVAAPLVGPVDIGNAAPPADLGPDLVWKTLVNGGFLGELWLLHVMPPLNGPFWSLNYEVWYYAMFGAWTFLSGRRRWLVLALMTAVIGPRILALLPIWLMGVAAYRWRPRIGRRTALLLFLGTGALALALIRMNVSKRIGYIDILGPSQGVIGDTVVGALIALHFVAARALGDWGRVILPLERPIRFLAGYTLSIYLFHLPLFALLWADLGLHSWVALPCLAVLVALLGEVTEKKVGVWRDAIRAALSRAARIPLVTAIRTGRAGAAAGSD